MAYIFRSPSVVIREDEYNKLMRISLALECIEEDIPQHKIETIIKNYGIYKSLG